MKKRGLVVYALGDYDLTEAGEVLAKHLNEQALATQVERMSDTATNSLPPHRAVVSRHQIALQVHARLDCGHDRNERVTFNDPGALVVTPGETLRCFDCSMVGAGLLPSEAQLAAFHGSATSGNSIKDQSNMATREGVINRLRPIYEAAIRDRSGVSIFLTGEELEVFTMDDLERFQDEIGYNDMQSLPPIA
ncbi:hypothetical protein D3C77_561620 [compost metagenome]